MKATVYCTIMYHSKSSVLIIHIWTTDGISQGDLFLKSFSKKEQLYIRSSVSWNISYYLSQAYEYISIFLLPLLVVALNWKHFPRLAGWRRESVLFSGEKQWILGLRVQGSCCIKIHLLWHFNFATTSNWIHVVVVWVITPCCSLVGGYQYLLMLIPAH
jgi:hypothetical protein